MIQKHEAIEAIINSINQKRISADFTKEITDLLPQLRNAVPIYFPTANDLINDVIKKDKLKGGYSQVHKNTFFSYTLKLPTKKNDKKLMATDFGIFALEATPKTNLLLCCYKTNKQQSKETLYFPLITVMDSSGYHEMYFDEKVPEHRRKEYSRGVACYCSHIIFFSRILSCKNISYVDHEAPEKVNKKRLKNNKEPIYTYKTLQVNLNPKYRKTDGASEKSDIMPLHICQGHFKEYTQENPLFGRITGRYWWQPHMRGNSKNGIVEKDYVIKP